MVKSSMSSTSTMDTSDDSSRYTGSAHPMHHHGHGGAPSPSSPKSYEKYILEVQSIMQRRLERAASASQPSTAAAATTALAEQEIETEIVHQLLSKIQQANYSSQCMIHRLQQDLGQSKSEVIECKSKIHQLSKRCTVAEMELKELRIAVARSSNSSGSGSGSGNSSPNKTSYYKRSSTGTSVTKTITDKSLENEEGEEEGCDYEEEEEGLEGGFPKVIGIPSHQESSEFREWMNKYSSNTPSSSESELLQGVEPIVEKEEDGEDDENGLDESSSSSSSTIYSPLVREFDDQMTAMLERRKVVMESMGGDKVAMQELDEQMAALLKEREIIKSLHDACDGSGEDETEDVFNLKEDEDHQPPLNGLGDNSSSTTGDVSIDEQYPKDTPQRRLSDYGGALTPIIETSDEPTPELSPILPRQNNNGDLAHQQQPSPPSLPLCSNILDNSNIGTRYDSRGRCINHPHVQLRKKKKRSLLLSKGSSPSKSNSKEVEWKIKYNCCPDCCIEHLSMLGQEVL